MTSATRQLEDTPRKRYEVVIKDGKRLVLVSHTTKEELMEYIDFLEKVCPKCNRQVNIDRINKQKNSYYCETCKKEYFFGEYQFRKWEVWMDEEIEQRKLFDADSSFL